jgi:hypothetical protein
MNLSGRHAVVHVGMLPLSKEQIMPRLLRRSRLGALLPALALVLTLAAHARAADPVAWKFTPGAKNRYRLAQNMTMSMDLGPGGKVDTKTSQVMDISWTVAEVKDDGSAVLKQKIDRIRMTMEAPGAGGTVEFDSQSTDEPQGFAAMVAPLLREMTRGEFTLTMTPRGKITDVEVPEGLVRALAAAPGASALGELTTAEGFKKMVGGVSFELPETLEPGAEQTSTAEMANPTLGKQVIKNSYRYIGPKEVEGVAYEAFAPSVEISFAGTDAVQAEVTEQKSEGEVLFNRDAGRLESSQLDHTLKLALTIGKQKVNQTLQQHVEFQWLPEDAE